jgi:hypothetical protein
MKELSDTETQCPRALDLVAYLYGEAGETEAKGFESHMRHCAACTNELQAFGRVRAHVGAWRTEALAGIALPAQATALAPAQESAVEASDARRPSALAALRQFFTLSPMWLRGATAFAGLALCALVVYAAVTLIEGPRVVVLEKVVEKGPTPAEVNALVDKKVLEQLALRERQQDATPQPIITPVSAPKNSVIARSTAGSRSGALARQSVAQRRAVAQVSAQESEQLARDLQLIPTRDEEDLPRLIDLIDEAN